MCFSDFSFRNTFCVSMGKTLWKSQNMSLNGFFWGKHHLAPAVLMGCLKFQSSGEVGSRARPRRSLEQKGQCKRATTMGGLVYAMQSNDPHLQVFLPVPVRGRSASSDVSSDISPSPLYIPPHHC